MKVAECRAKPLRVAENDRQIVLRRILLNSLMKVPGTEGEDNCVSKAPVRFQARRCFAGGHVVELCRGEALRRSPLVQAERVGCLSALALCEGKSPMSPRTHASRQTDCAN